MLVVAAIAAFVLGSVVSVWLLWVRSRAGLLLTPKQLLAPVELLVTLQAWLAGAGMGALMTLEAYAGESDPHEAALVSRAALTALAAWLPIAVGLMFPTARRLRDHDGSPFVHLNSAIAYSVVLIAWFGTGRWEDAF
ncbi:hypothetical protein Pla163_14700 [Planctomycetes bacterium Pla163]|uniref:Uncharacterized protein n=1 Tax=Rohdeia mirabilis TaxID=2528008 RepID=A0A518CYQ3_9BACT|nr:hypothetical protein Pla163_14700 [Planctomycetes bacterium Pla163]